MFADRLPDFCAENDNHSAQVIQIDSSRHVSAVAWCAAICGICAGVSWWSVDRQQALAKQYRDDSIDIQTQYERERNHVIELEARLKVLSEQVQENHHVR